MESWQLSLLRETDKQLPNSVMAKITDMSSLLSPPYDIIGKTYDDVMIMMTFSALLALCEDNHLRASDAEV